METVSFSKMEDGTAEEYAFLETLYTKCSHDLPDRVMGFLKQMQGDRLGYQIDRYDHSLQSATRAERDGADEETIVCALLHDIGDVLSPDNHSQVVAAILQPFISERNFWVLKHHGLFQGYYYFHHINKDRNIREKFKDHQFYQACVDFCFKWDQCSFDPNYDNLPLEHFEPMVRRVMSEPWTHFD
ncbi:MAG: HD domain-containing protein [SAR324 cluster bacterium]|nr:HD domain-containing protein [SAR324 cluster bacterium]